MPAGWLDAVGRIGFAACHAPAPHLHQHGHPRAGGHAPAHRAILLRKGYEPEWQDIFGTEPGDLRDMLRGRAGKWRGAVPGPAGLAGGSSSD